MKNKLRQNNAAFYLAMALFIIAFILVSGITSAFGGYSVPTEGEWYNTSWNYRIKLEINSTAVNRTNWPVEITLNFTNLLPSGTFDNNSIRVFEYNYSGKIKYEIPSQFDKDDYYNNVTNALGELVFLMNGTTLANTTRIFYVYYDVVESGAKPIKSYATNISYGWDGQQIDVNNTKLEFWIDTNRGENTSGLFQITDRGSEVPIITENNGGRTAEYIELFNGTVNTTFDLRNNATFISGPVRLTIKQEGEEIVFGNVSARTNVGRIVKKYYIYTSAGNQVRGTFIKISQEIFFNTTVNRSNLYSGALALDVNRTFLSTNMPSYGNSSVDPYSWAYASDSGGSIAGIINVNETTSNYFASLSPPEPAGIGRIGISLSNTTIASSSIKQVSLLYFGRGGSFGVSEFLLVRDGASTNLTIKQNLTEKWAVIITPSINLTT
ncbi:MAG: hypothetical protein NT120_00575, partial [Candidatus Aenigmarchaeota archaeon]|nr:hypothetical protein [Candidatus Aenigmarchaeota archaeon]